MRVILKKIYNHLKELETSDSNVNREKSYIFIEKNIDELDKTCCCLPIRVFDFDEAKEKINKEINRGSIRILQPKSCDALKVCYDTNKFDLIEMKGIKNFINYMKEDVDPKEFDRLLENKVYEYNEECKEKLRCSCEIIRQVTINNATIQLNKKEKEKFKKMSKNYYLLTDYSVMENPIESFAVNLFALSHPTNRGMDIMVKKMKAIIGEDIDSQIGFSKPVVVTAEDLEKIYSIEGNVGSAI